MYGDIRGLSVPFSGSNSVKIFNIHLYLLKVAVSFCVCVYLCVCVSVCLSVLFFGCDGRVLCEMYAINAFIFG